MATARGQPTAKDAEAASLWALTFPYWSKNDALAE